MSDKICNNCGNKVNETANFCPKCKSTSFRNIYEISKPNNSLVYRLFYNYQESYFILSKSKVAAVLVFLLFMTLAVDSPAIIPFAAVAAALVYVIGNAIHNLIGDDGVSGAVIENSNYGLLTDLKHLFFYWQDSSTGEFVLSKTKTVTVLVFLLFASLGALFGLSGVFALSLFGLSIAIPVFFAGYGIHRITTSDPVQELIDRAQTGEAKKEIKVEPKRDVHDFDHYRTRLNELKIMYEIKEKNARKLIEERFTPPQLTYDRFIATVDNSTAMFNENADAISDILNLASKDSSKVDDEISSRMGVLESLVDKMDELIDELVLNMSETERNDEDATSFLQDMEHLINSVKDYQH